MELLTVLGILILMSGTILIYDARQITKKLFSYGKQNEETRALKLIGFILSIVGGLLIML